MRKANGYLSAYKTEMFSYYSWRQTAIAQQPFQEMGPWTEKPQCHTTIRRSSPL